MNFKCRYVFSTTANKTNKFRLAGVVLDDLLGRGNGISSLSQALESLERVVDKHPVLVAVSSGGSRRISAAAGVVVHVAVVNVVNLEIHVRELVKVGRVVDALDLDGDGGGPLPDMFPIHRRLSPEESQSFDFFQTLHPLLVVSAESEITTLTQWIRIECHFAFLPSDCLLGGLRDRDFRRKNQRFPPVHDFPISFLRRLRAKRRIANQHLVHYHAEAPPITARRVTSLEEHLRSWKRRSKSTLIVWRFTPDS